MSNQAVAFSPANYIPFAASNTSAFRTTTSQQQLAEAAMSYTQRASASTGIITAAMYEKQKDEETAYASLKDANALSITGKIREQLGKYVRASNEHD